MKKFICMLIACLLGGVLLTGNCNGSICDTSESVVFFGNGIKTLERNAYNSLYLMKKRLQAELAPEEFKVLEFRLAYNDTHGLPLDLLEATIQILTGNTSRFWRLFWGLEIMPDWFADKLVLLATAIDRSALVTSDSLKDHVNTYKTQIAEGKKVLLVAHSQGNLFGNQAYGLLDSREKQSFGMVSVANVDNNVLGGDSPYTTLVNDKVILALIGAQVVLPTKPMAPNTENVAAPGDSLGHYFIQSYMMEGSNSNNKVTGDIIAALGSLVKPVPIVASGVITVSLTWGREPDVDLHVYEPNGMQVSWYSLQGYSGTLDRDDRSGYGPEHYTVPTCETLEPGVYQIALDYFKGYGPEVAKIQVEAGLLVKSFEIPMPSEDYGSPNHPVLIANILVKNGENGNYDFEIYE